jgi:hypothetical protein
MLLLLVSTLALVIAGCVVHIFEVTNSQAGETESILYSVLLVGSRVPSAALQPNDVGIRWIQAMYFLLRVCIAAVEFSPVCHLVPLANDGAMAQTRLFAGGNHILMELN